MNTVFPPITTGDRLGHIITDALSDDHAIQSYWFKVLRPTRHKNKSVTCKLTVAAF